MPDTLSASTVIAVTPEQAYAAVSDVTRTPEWSPETYRVVWLSKANSFRGWNRNGSARWFTHGTVVSGDPGKEFAFDIHLVGFSIARWTFTFEPVGDGSCRLTETWTDQRGDGPLGRLKRVCGRLLSRTPHDTSDTPKNLATTLERIRVALEATASN